MQDGIYVPETTATIPELISYSVWANTIMTTNNAYMSSCCCFQGYTPVSFLGSFINACHRILSVSDGQNEI